MLVCSCHRCVAPCTPYAPLPGSCFDRSLSRVRARARFCICVRVAPHGSCVKGESKRDGRLAAEGASTPREHPRGALDAEGEVTARNENATDRTIEADLARLYVDHRVQVLPQQSRLTFEAFELRLRLALCWTYPCVEHEWTAGYGRADRPSTRALPRTAISSALGIVPTRCRCPIAPHDVSTTISSGSVVRPAAP